jgi:hypothetical protein
MHYRNGREAKVGDRVVGADCGGNPISGVLIQVNAEGTTCNGRLVNPSNAAYVTISDLLHADDLPKPQGK